MSSEGKIECKMAFEVKKFLRASIARSQKGIERIGSVVIFLC